MKKLFIFYVFHIDKNNDGGYNIVDENKYCKGD